MTSRMIPLTLILVLAASMPAQSLHGGCNGAITEIALGPETLYVEDRDTLGAPIDTWFFDSVWFYIESNGVEGLQSGGSVDRDQGDWEPVLITDLCAHGNPDTLII